MLRPIRKIVFDKPDMRAWNTLHIHENYARKNRLWVLYDSGIGSLSILSIPRMVRNEIYEKFKK